MKNKLLSIFSVLLISCQYSPAYAQIVDKTLNTTKLNQVGVELTLCKDIADFAYVAMQARQNGVSKEAQLSLASVPTTQDEAMLKVILDGIIHDANIFPVYDDMSDKVEVSERFSEVIYNICKGEK